VVAKRFDYREHLDPEYQRWGRKYPRFPGVAECAHLIRAGKARGAWADIIAEELACHAGDCFTELIETFRSDPSDSVRLYVLMALETAALPQAVPFLTEVLRGNDPGFALYAERGLRAINTPESRTALWHATHPSS
jgi:hypothetical protein